MTASLLGRRVLGAVRFLDVTERLPVTSPLDVRATGVRWIRNRRGYHVIADAPGLTDYASEFDAQPTDVELGSIPIELTVTDPSGQYLARRHTIYLPRDPDPSHAPADARPGSDFDSARDPRVGSVFVPIDVAMFPAPSAPTGPGWAVVRATVAGVEPATVLAGALVRVERKSDRRHLASGLSDARGEVLVAVAGIPVTTWTRSSDDGSVTTSSVDVRLEVIHDATAGAIPDPYDLEKRRSSLHVRDKSETLVSGREVVTTI